MRKVLILAALLGGLTALIRYLPLSWVAAPVPDAVGTFSGTYWNGQVSDVPLFGTLAVNGGLGAVRLTSPPGDVRLSGEIGPSHAADIILSMPVAALPASDARLSGLEGRLSLQIGEARFSDGACQSAAGTASTNVLAANRTRLGWQGPDLSGPVDCAEGRLRVRLSGQTGAETVRATIVTGLDGVYRSDIEVETPDPVAGNALALFGFNPAGSDLYTLSEQGRWR